MSVSRRLARDVARCLDAFARPCVTSIGRASTSAVATARWKEAATRATGGQSGIMHATTMGSTRAFATSATPTRRRAMDASIRGRGGKAAPPPAAAQPGASAATKSESGRKRSASGESTRVDATAETTTTSGPELSIRFRTHLVKNDLDINPNFYEVWGETMRARWKFTYPAPMCFKALYAYKFTVLTAFVLRSSWLFVPYFLAAYTPVWLASAMMSGMGLVGFLLLAKTVGLGEPAFAMMNYANSAGDYVGVENLMLNLCAALVTIRTSYYTLPVVIFVWEEIVYNLRRVRRLARWIR